MAQFLNRLDAQQRRVVSLPEGRREDSLNYGDQISGLRRESGGHLVYNYC